MTEHLIEQAVRAAAAARARGPHSAPADGRARTRRVCIGDPQADLRRVLGSLAHHALLGEDGRLLPDVLLVSVGDHFDWGPPAERERSAESGLLFVAWLASHPADQAVMLLGNHDLGRVGELHGFSDDAFARVRAEADRAYRGGDEDRALEADFLARHPQLPSAEVAARDFSAFSTEQAAWVEHLLRARRFRVAYAAGPRLLVLHAGVTRADLEVTKLAPSEWQSAPAVARALNGALERAVDAWDGRAPLHVPGLHQPGSSAEGEGRGIFYHRPSLLPYDAVHHHERTPRRRFDVRRLPAGLTQVVGHSRDKKIRELLDLPLEDAKDGVLRHLVTDGTRVDYALGTPTRALGPGEAALVFTDGGMRETAPHAYELLDLDTLGAARPR